MLVGRAGAAALVVIATGGCDRRAAPSKAAPPSAPDARPAPLPLARDAAAALDATVPVDAPPATDATAPPGPPAAVEVGATPRGCVGWADEVPSAACVVGELLDRGPNLRLVFLGVSAPALPLGPRLDAADVARVNAALADRGYVALPGESTPLMPGQPLVRSGVTLTLESHPAAPSGSGAPVDRLLVRVTCGGRDTELINDFLEDTTLDASVRTIGARLIIELVQHVARGDRRGVLFGATVLDTTTCRFGSER
ncbi:MAG: hypothetical protein IPH44_42215 [Myxococcales bacterium]|nr:hypothetical protein [Myxococcales bacterium]MBK7192989.1 hypothetical protein [Myxococcales bacterium]MBP6844153.1 hypothetical protein [Kofleriaceae bacterium]